MGLKEYIFGFDSEDNAVSFLKNESFDIVCRNYKTKVGEIDIIAKKDDIYHFIEVKATAGNYEALYRITKSKYNKILKAINLYIQKHNIANDFQVDVIIIQKNQIDFIQNVSV